MSIDGNSLRLRKHEAPERLNEVFVVEILARLIKEIGMSSAWH